MNSPSNFRQHAVVQGVDRHQLCTRPPQGLQIVRVVEAERLVHHHADTHLARPLPRRHQRRQLSRTLLAAAGGSKQAIEVNLGRDGRTDAGDMTLRFPRLVAGNQTEMTFDDGELAVAMHRAQNRDVGVVLDHRPQLGLVARTA